MKVSRLLITGALAVLAIAVSSYADSGSQPAGSTTPSAGAAGSSAMPVSLEQYFNDRGIYADGAQFTDGIDKDGYACSSNLLAVQKWTGVPFTLNSVQGVSNVVTCAGQKIALAQPGHFSKLDMLALAVNGAQADQVFTVTYADNSTQDFKQSLSDWAQPDDNSGEAKAVTMEYRDQSDGSRDENTYYIFRYSFDLNATNGLQSLKLPVNENVKVFALTLVP